MFWDEEIVYQSHRLKLYKDALDKLQTLNLVFPCGCSRKELSDLVYPGTCRSGIKENKKANSYRIKVDNCNIEINDQLQGVYTQQLDTEVGDFVIKRADGFFAYHLATVVDDEEQNITDVVRGIDLLESTPRQVYIQNKLNYDSPSYLHLPIAVNQENKKISKSIDSAHIDLLKPAKVIFDALTFLGQNPPEELIEQDIETVLNWSIDNWNIDILPKQSEIMIK